MVVMMWNRLTLECVDVEDVVRPSRGNLTFVTFSDIIIKSRLYRGVAKKVNLKLELEL